MPSAAGSYAANLSRGVIPLEVKGEKRPRANGTASVGPPAEGSVMAGVAILLALVRLVR